MGEVRTKPQVEGNPATTGRITAMRPFAPQLRQWRGRRGYWGHKASCGMITYASGQTPTHLACKLLGHDNWDGMARRPDGRAVWDGTGQGAQVVGGGTERQTIVHFTFCFRNLDKTDAEPDGGAAAHDAHHREDHIAVGAPVCVCDVEVRVVLVAVQVASGHHGRDKEHEKKQKGVDPDHFGCGDTRLFFGIVHL